MSHLGSTDPVVVSRESFDHPEPGAVVQSNIDVVNALSRALFRPDEISRDAWRSYYVDYYLSELRNGGFSQFVYNSEWDERVIALVVEGLACIGANRHLALFKQVESLVASSGAQVTAFLSSDYFGPNAERDRFDAITEQFYEINEVEDLLGRNARWLKSLSNLQVLTRADLQAAIEQRATALPDRAEREARARANEPAWLQTIRALCAACGQRLVRLNAGKAQTFEGRQVFAHHFVTDKGRHYMVELEGKALLFSGKRHVRVAEIPLTR